MSDFFEKLAAGVVRRDELNAAICASLACFVRELLRKEVENRDSS